MIAGHDWKLEFKSKASTAQENSGHERKFVRAYCIFIRRKMRMWHDQEAGLFDFEGYPKAVAN